MVSCEEDPLFLAYMEFVVRQTKYSLKSATLFNVSSLLHAFSS